jgi:hypothetical protein
LTDLGIFDSFAFSIKGSKGLIAGWRRGIFEGCFGSSTGERDGDFFAVLGSHQVGIAAAADPLDPQRDEALVLVDLTEEASEAGEDWPDDALE